MIRGRLVGVPGRRRPFVTARLAIASQQIADDVNFLVDTGADSTLLAPADALFLGFHTAHLPPGPSSTGVGGLTTTVYAAAALTIGSHMYDLSLRILAPRSPRQQSALARIPSLLGRDILSHFALFFEERTGKVLLLEPHEADALGLS